MEPTKRVGGWLLMPPERSARSLRPECRLQFGFVQWRDEHIEDVQIVPPSERLPELDAGGPGCVILPGMVDAHVHLPQFPITGAHGMPLLRWLDEVVFPTEARWTDADHARVSIRQSLRQLLSHGTIGIMAFATSDAAAAAMAIEQATRWGMLGGIGHVLMDRHALPELLQPANASLEASKTLIDRFGEDAPVQAIVTPRFAISCTERLLHGAGDLARQTDAAVQTHLAETRAECRAVSELFDGRSYVDVYDRSGLATSRSYFGHGIHLADDDRQLMAGRQSTVVHCPTANRFLHSGRMDWLAHRDQGLSVLLGSDIGAGYERSMVRVARDALLTAGDALADRDAFDSGNDPGDAPPRAAEAWYWITAGAAKRLSMPTGVLETGTRADFSVVHPNYPIVPPDPDPMVDPLDRLMFDWDDRWLDRVCVRGRWFDPTEP